jgi:NAD(P)-dependent dehydrogenase (short-subunit alcohol dehydrogenase family)
MTQHPALQPGRTAVITGGASGIGLAAAERFAGLGLNVLIADVTGLEEAAETVRAVAKPDARVEAVKVDVSDFAQVRELSERAFDDFGDVAVVMNNAGVAGGGSALENLDSWRRVLDAQGRPGLIINTGSKQGITAPPGDTAYNVSKAAIKTLTEGLQHTLRNTEGCQVTAHLLVPGSTFTGMTRRGRGGEKPAGAWTPEQVIDFMLERLAAGDFYILCPDNEVTRAMDNARMAWAIGDLIENRPPLSRWHPDHKDAFAAFLAERTRTDG